MAFTFDDYRKYYPYGASAVFSNNPNVNANTNKHRLNNLERFLSENPSVIHPKKIFAAKDKYGMVALGNAV